MQVVLRNIRGDEDGEEEGGSIGEDVKVVFAMAAQGQTGGKEAKDFFLCFVANWLNY